jgi:hypothetical protein
MGSNDLEWKHVTCQPVETQVAAAGNCWERELCLECQSLGSVLNQETTKVFHRLSKKKIATPDCELL